MLYVGGGGDRDLYVIYPPTNTLCFNGEKFIKGRNVIYNLTNHSNKGAIHKLRQYKGGMKIMKDTCIVLPSHNKNTQSGNHR